MSAIVALSIREQLVEAVGNGARTVNAIIEQSGLTKKQVMDNLCHLKNDGTIVTTAAGMELRAGHKMPVKVTKPKPGEMQDFAPPPTGKAMATHAIDAAADSLNRKIDPPSVEHMPASFEDYVEAAKPETHPDLTPTPADALPAACRRIAKEFAPTTAPRTNGAGPKLLEAQPEWQHAAGLEFKPDPLIVANLGEYVVIRKSDLRELVGAVEVVGRWRDLAGAIA